MPVDIKIIRLQELSNVIISLRVNQYCADDSIFGLTAVGYNLRFWDLFVIRRRNIAHGF
jgi:hypothetical protein